MSYAELISMLSALPVERRIELFDLDDLVAACFALATHHTVPDAGFSRMIRHDETVFYLRGDASLHRH